MFLNLFNRAPDAAGLEFWSGALLSAIAGDEGALSVGEIILAIIEGAQDSAEGNDRTTILNKIEVATTWTDAADAAGIDYTSDTAAQNSAKSIIEGVTDAAATVTAAKSTIDGVFASTAGEEFRLTLTTDEITGTDNDDTFNAYVKQDGGLSNSLSSADILDGGAGNDRLYADLTSEYLGNSGDAVDYTDIQPRVKNIEEIDIEARDYGDGAGAEIVVDGKHITDHVEIGSYYSDGDLRIENLTTLTSSGYARDTSEITITMDHTDNFNSDDDASDLTVLFDNDYILGRGQTSEGQIFYFLLDEDAELAGNPNRLNNIDVDGIRFTIDTGNGPVDVTIESDAANTAGTHQGFVNALQAPLQALIQDGTLPAGTTLTLDPTITDVTFLDDGSQSDTIPAIVLTSGDGSEVIATGFSRIEEEIGEYDVYGRFNSVNEVEDQPISINIDLHKVGRGGDGGDLIIGGKASYGTADGIEAGIGVFNINVLGAGNDDPNGMMTKPSSLGTIQSTWGVLDVVNIATDPVYAAGDTYASLEVRDGFDGNTSLINADAFLGDLMLNDVTNSDTITAQGGGDVTLGLVYNGNESNTAYSVTTGGGDDTVMAFVDGDALDYLNSSFSVSTGDGMDIVSVNLAVTSGGEDEEELNQAILDNFSIDTGADDDIVQLLGNGVANISTGSGDDTITTDGGGNVGIGSWAFNFDALRAEAGLGIDEFLVNDMPGEQTSPAYVGGATVTVTFSGAGVDGDVGNGGGVMAFDIDDPEGASAGQDGYEASAVISDLINGNDFYGDQRDVNAAIIDAIESDPILSQLLTATIGANNTLFIASNTSGSFDATDLRIEIERPTLDSWTAVQTEARSVFSDSSITVGSVADADAPTGQDLESSDGADQWFDGLSAAGDDDNSTHEDVGEGESNLHNTGSASIGEVDTVINGGTGDDLIVLSTDSTFIAPDNFTVSSNNALLNGASNETIVLTGDDFGDDTVMNFTSGVLTQQFTTNVATVILVTEGSDEVPSDGGTPGAAEVFVLELSDAEVGEAGAITFRDGSVTVVETDTAETLVAKFLDDENFIPTGWTTSAGPTASTVTFTAAAPGIDQVNLGQFTASDTAGSVLLGLSITTQGTSPTDPSDVVAAVPAVYEVVFGSSFVDTTYTFDGETIPVLDGQTGDDIARAVAQGNYDNWTATNTSAGVVTFTANAAGAGPEIVESDFVGANITDIAEIPGAIINQGTDFLDFTAYLTSEEDVSTGTPDSTDSEQVIDVTLNHNPASAAPGADIQANEVVTVVYTDDTNETGTFANLSAADIEGLFSGVDFDGGALAAADFDVVDAQTDDQVVDGNGKAIIMVENAGNDGEYKVFELTWDASEGDGDEGVSAVALGSLDFGDSLHDLSEVNLIGSDAHDILLANGFNMVG